MSNYICKVCDSNNTEPDIQVSGRQRYKCLDCKILFFDDGNHSGPERSDLVVVAKAEPEPEPEPVTELAPVKVYHCKKCGYSTSDKYKLTGHYSSNHSWHHRRKEVTVQEQPVSTEEPEPVPEPEPKPKLKRNYRKGHPLSYWKTNREKVMADYYSMKLMEFFKAWHLSSTTWASIRDSLEIPKKSTRAIKEAKPSTPRAAPVAGTLPVFPGFSDKWLATVQEEWFKTYLELKKLERK